MRACTTGNNRQVAEVSRWQPPCSIPPNSALNFAVCTSNLVNVTLAYWIRPVAVAVAVLLQFKWLIFKVDSSGKRVSALL
jgi:hypothetical protein